MLKKSFVLTAGVAAALVVAAPLASAHEGGHGDDHGSHSGHGSHGGNSNGGRDGGNSNECGFRAGSGDSNVEQGDAGLAGNINAVAPVGGVVAPILTCDNISILNNTLDNNQVNVLSGLLG